MGYHEHWDCAAIDLHDTSISESFLHPIDVLVDVAARTLDAALVTIGGRRMQWVKNVTYGYQSPNDRIDTRTVIQRKCEGIKVQMQIRPSNGNAIHVDLSRFRGPKSYTALSLMMAYL